MYFDVANYTYKNPVTWITGVNTFENGSFKTEDSIVINHKVEDRSFLPYFTISEILDKIYYEYQDRHPFKIEEVKVAFNNLMNAWKSMDMASDSIIFSIIRRISRESSATAKLIDHLAEKIVDLVREDYFLNKRRLVLLIGCSEWIDRPSIRVINRVFKLLPFSHLRMVWTFSDNVPNLKVLENSFSMNDSLKVARGRIFTRLYSEQNPLLLGESEREANFDHTNFKGSGHGLMADAAISLVTQNYENAYLACEIMLNKNKISEETYRIVGLVHANLTLYDKAYEAFKTASEVADTNPKRAHIECLSALLAIKRFYNLEIAKEHYKVALKYVDESDAENRLEKGWILNGLSFMETVLSSKLQGDEKEVLLEGVLKRELKALQLIKNDKGSGPLYLRYNLISNISFLLEIRGDYLNSLETWRRAFTKLIGEDHEFCYRAGMLSWKAGHIDEGISYLNKGLKQAILQRDRLDTECIYYGLGYVHYINKNYKDAAYNFLEGFRCALNLSNWDQAKKHIIGCIVSSKNTGNDQINIGLLTDMISDQPCPNDVLNLLKEDRSYFSDQIFHELLHRPKTKLSSYHPSVDLEAIPEIDMNDFLINKSTVNFKQQIPN